MCYGHAHALSQSHESQSLDRMLDWKQQLATPGCGALAHYKKPNSLTVKPTVTPTTGSKNSNNTAQTKTKGK